MGDYAAVILYFRLGDTVRTTLDRLLAQEAAPAQIVLVDNASGDGVVDALTPDYPSVTIVTSPANAGYSGGMRIGVDAITAAVDWVLLLTHEVRLAPDCVARMLQSSAAARDGRPVGLIGPVLERTGTEQIWSAGGLTSWSGRVSHSVAADADRDVAWIDGACMLASRPMVDVCGLPDPRFFAYYEDVEYGLRVNDRFAVRVAATARAQQDTSLTPVYFEARNSLVLWRTRRDAVRWTIAFVRQLAKLVIDTLRGPAAVRDARMAGIRDGLGGGLHLEHAGVRRP